MAEPVSQIVADVANYDGEDAKHKPITAEALKVRGWKVSPPAGKGYVISGVKPPRRAK